ncbi:mannosyltransferase family protein [Aliinostoc sp. HNIBRCY26]|uniref:mannosyltransferase family protein n=1 Tax=Aliinostoc sp. HNIBRCY26 TaxID=3418997 RepID=UPI003D018DD0
MTTVQILIRKVLWKNHIFFPVLMWFLSRVIIWTTMLLITPTLFSSIHWHWGIFDAWDGVHYRAIATTGYEFVNDGKQHNLAFFPLFPFSIKLLMQLGLSFEVAGLLINNLAFLAALYCLYLWLKEFYGIRVAQWGTAILCWYPASMFTGVIYTEGLYLFLSTATLRAFDTKKYSWMAIWGAMATATRPTGLALIPALIMAAIKERRNAIAYLASLATATGVLLFSLYCTIRFHDPLAFIAAQRGWRPSLGFDWQGWLNMVMQIVVGEKNWQFGWVKATSGWINDPWHPLIFILLSIGAYCLYHFRKSWIAVNLAYGFYTLVLLLLIWTDTNLMNQILNAFMVLGGIYCLWCCRQQLTPVTLMYGFCGVGLLLASGGTISLSRLAYGIVPLNVAMGLLVSRHPRLGSFTLGLFVALLAKLAVGFAQEQWVG